MDATYLVGLIQESLFMILVFCGALLFAMMRGRQGIINLILSLYLALLISIKFPYYDFFLGGDDQSSNALVMIIIFVVFTIGGLFLFGKLMPREEFDTAFQGFGKKVIFALMTTILIMIFSYHALPVTDLITPGSPIQALFGPEENFFWWLMLPLIGLFFL